MAARITPERPADPSRFRGLLDRATSPAGLFVAAAFVITLLPVTSIVHDPDFWWHLRAGQLILAHGGLLGIDPFTFTVPTHAWTMHEWLTEVLYAALQSAAGLGVIVLLLSLVTWGGIACIGLRAALRQPNRFILGLGLLVTAVAGYPIWGPRVQMVTFCFAALTLLLVERHIVRGGRLVWLLVPLYLLWSNLHSGFIIGLGFIALVVVAETVGRWFSAPDRAPAKRLRTLLLVLAACTAVSLINPNGPAILVYAFFTQGSGAQQALILEWHSPDFQDWVVVPFGLMLLSLLAMVAVNRRLRARDAALLIAGVALSLQSVRHIAIFLAAAAPIWIDQATMVARRLRWQARQRPLPSLRFRAVVFAGLIGGLLAGYGAGRLVPAMQVQLSSLTYAQQYPVCAARWLAQAPEPLRIFNQYGEGGYLALALSAKGDKIYIFGDAALMGDALLYKYASITSVQPGWSQAIRSSGAQIVLYDANTPLADVMRASPSWVEVYHDPLSVAFVPADEVGTLRLAPVPASYPPGDPCGRLATTSVNPNGQNQ
ncbi:MAG TPA: hypothetical protein VF155_12355 [Candidatus Dormibacteraeota bacterium]